jgi:hypothetical protein
MEETFYKDDAAAQAEDEEGKAPLLLVSGCAMWSVPPARSAFVARARKSLMRAKARRCSFSSESSADSSCSRPLHATRRVA